MLLAALVHVAVVCPLLCTLHEQLGVAPGCIVVVVVEVVCGCELLRLRVQSASQLLTLFVLILACMLFVSRTSTFLGTRRPGQRTGPQALHWALVYGIRIVMFAMIQVATIALTATIGNDRIHEDPVAARHCHLRFY